MASPPRPVIWMGDSLDVLREFPALVQDEVGYALYLAQIGAKYVSAKPLKGFGSGVLEVLADQRGDTFRAVYTVRFGTPCMCCTHFRRSRRGASVRGAGVESGESPAEVG
ncbi:MAG: type II toxin-antitoxin system RelE/ParE family toxin [bacterium]